MLPRLRLAVTDLSWLLTRGYAQPSSVKIVGDRYELDARQRSAVTRAACADDDLVNRLRKQADGAKLVGQTLLLDGYNVLTTIETALGGGVIFRGRDGCIRDIAGLHGTWRRVAETMPAIEQIGTLLTQLQVSRARWLLDRPVSNSARLAGILRDLAKQRGWQWEVDVVAQPDKMLVESDQFIATADSAVLDRTRRWFNLVDKVVGRMIAANILDVNRLLDLQDETSVRK